MGWFKKDKAKERTETLELLQDIIIYLALTSSVDLKNRWQKDKVEDTTHPNADYFVRMELLSFCLHLANRYAFCIGGMPATEKLQEAITGNILEKLTKNSLGDNVGLQERDKWFKYYLDDATNWVSNAEKDYRSFRTLDETLSIELEAAIGNKLTQRMSQRFGKEQNLENFTWRMPIHEVSADIVSKSKFRELVEKACKTLS